MQANKKNKSIPNKTGIGLRSCHYQYVIKKLPKVAWFEVHSENFFANGGINLFVLDKISKNYPLSFHGVGLSLGSADGVDINHLKKLKTLIDCYNPSLVSEHVSWSRAGDIVANDLLPMPYTQESLQILTDNIKQTQDFLGRKILIENPSSYMQFKCSKIPEDEFIAMAANQAGCGLLLDINNIYVTHKNHNISPLAYINTMLDCDIGEIHLAGHAVCNIEDQEILIDDHGDFICDEVWQLYQYFLSKHDKVPTLIEWDSNIPDFVTLLAEAKKADELLLA